MRGETKKNSKLNVCSKSNNAVFDVRHSFLYYSADGVTSNDLCEEELLQRTKFIIIILAEKHNS